MAVYINIYIGFTNINFKRGAAMKKNESSVDRVIRLVLGIILVAFGIYEVSSAMVPGVILIIIGAILLITGITGFCALYALMGISTCKNCKKD
jgi:uncharacterized membrane protein HdeD (DUF308 family)